MSIHFLTYGDGNFSKRKNILVEELKEANLNPKIDFYYAWDRNDIPEFYDAHKNIMDTLPCSGRFIWKPYIILKLLRSIPDNDYLIYCDSGCTIINRGEFKEGREARYQEYFEFLNSARCPILGFAPLTEDWSAPYYTQIDGKHTVDLLEKYDLNKRDFLDMAGVEAGFLLIKNNEQTKSVIKFWLDMMTDNDYYNTKNNYSADQGLLNICFYIFSCTMMLGLDFYGQGPFFAARYTDYGQKEGWNAPII